MANYLTPARISTLVLIDLYATEDFWKYSSETSTAFLEIIAEQYVSLQLEGTASDLSRLSSPSEHVLAFGERLSKLESYVPGRSWLSVFLRKLWEVTTLNEVHDVFERCHELLVPMIAVDPRDVDLPRQPRITRASPVGQFIRRCNVESTRLQFADSMTLWGAFVAYRQPSYESWAQHYPDAAKALAELELAERNLSGPERLSESSFVGENDVEVLLSASISQLQKLGQRIPKEAKVKIEQWLVHQQTLNLQSLQHFMVFFESWRAGQYSTALENLHRYFDYSYAKGAGDNMKVYYQYALLHLSVLHADFERWDESVSAMEECIATARENQDTACLNFALSWLIFLRQSRGVRETPGLRSLAAIAGEGGTEQDELAFLKAKAKDSKHWTLMSSTLLEEAKFEMRHHGVSAKSFEQVIQASYLNVQHASYSLLPASTIFQATIFDRLGQPHVAKRLHESALSTYSSHCSLGDRARIMCRLAYDSAQRGAYTAGLAVLAELRLLIKGTLKLEQRVTAFVELLALMQATRRFDVEAAEHHLTNLLPIRSSADPDVAGPINFFEIALLMKKHRYDTALSKINNLLTRAKAEADGDIAETLSLMVLKANLFAAAGKAPKGLSIAIRAAATAERCHLYAPLIEALAALSRILNDLGEFDASKNLTEAALPHALEGSNPLVTAQLFVTLGETYVGLLGRDAEASQATRSQLVHSASAYIERGRGIYAKIDEYNGQLDCLLMQSRLAQWNDDEASAAHADDLYLQLISDHERGVAGEE